MSLAPIVSLILGCLSCLRLIDNRSILYEVEATSNTEFVEKDKKKPWVIFLCLLFAAIGTVLLYRELNKGVGSSGGEVFAVVYRKDAQVRKRTSSSYIWGPVKVNEEIHQKEYIQTGAGSSAIVEFKNGKTLELQENSLIVIDNTDDLALNFVKGTGVMKSGDKDTSISVNENGQASSREFKVKQLGPDNLADVILDDKSKEVHLAWSSAPPLGSNAVLEISKTKEFKPKQTQNFSISGKNDWSGKLPEGRYHWRITEGKEVVSSVSRFSVVSPPEINPISPNANSIVKVISSKSLVRFQWSAKNIVESLSYKIEISKDKNFEKIFLTTEINPTKGALGIRGIESGNYYWRIKTTEERTKEKKVFLSTVQPAIVKSINHVEVIANYPENESAYKTTQAIKFGWSSDVASDEIYYELEMKDESSGKITKLIAGNEMSYILNQASPGVYLWRAIARVDDKTYGESKWRTLSLFSDNPLALISPKKDDKFQYWDQKPEIGFTWDKDELIAKGLSYKIDVSETKDFAKVIFEKTLKDEKLDGIK